MNGPEWLRVCEVAKIMRVNPSTISERARNRTRVDAIPLHLISGSGHAMRIHRSVAYPVLAAPTPLIPRYTKEEATAIAEEAIARFVARLGDIGRGRNAA